MSRRLLVLFVVASFSLTISIAQENGKFQIHFMEFGQGDDAILISPECETVREVSLSNGLGFRSIRNLGETTFLVCS